MECRGERNVWPAAGRPGRRHRAMTGGPGRPDGGTVALMDEALEEHLARWRAAGLLDDAAVAGIRAHETARGTATGAPAADRSPMSPQRVSLQEVLAYAGAALALAGGALLVALHRDDLGLPGRLAVYAVVALSALFASRQLAGADGAGRRAAAICLMLSILGAGMVVGDAAASAGLLTHHHLYPSVPGTAIPSYDDVDRSGNAALALGVVALLALAGLWRLRSSLLATLLAVAAFGATFTALGSSNAGRATWGLVTLLPGTLLIATSLLDRLRHGPPGEVLRLAGTLVPAVTLYLAGGGSLGGPLTGLGGAVGAMALLTSPRLNSNALALAGGLGIFGLVVSVGARWFAAPLGLPLVFMAAGVTLIGVAVLIQRTISGNRSSLAVGSIPAG